jgi:hypothetical protein
MATIPTVSESSALRGELIVSPSELSAERSAELTADIVRLSTLATSQGDLSYRPALEGWTRYYTTLGDRVQDYHRLSLIYAGQTAISIAALKLFRTKNDPQMDVIWLQLILTRPDFQNTAATVRALTQLLADPSLLRQLGRGYLVARTPNPLVYEAARRMGTWIGKRGMFEVGAVLPTILPGAQLAPIPSEHAAHLQEIVGMISDPSKFKIETSVVAGYYAAFGDLYKNYDFRCRNAAVREYFARHVRWETQDGFFLAVPFDATAKPSEV